MPILSSELKKYGALSRPEDDASASGGGIDASCVLDVTQLAANDQLRAVSDNAADTMNLTITGRDATGAIVTETKALNGTTPVTFATTFERFLKATLSAAPAGNVTIERNTSPYDDVVIIPAGKTAASILFIDATSEAVATTRYEKEFWRNENASLTLTNATVTLTADPSASIRIGLATAKGDTVSVTNRKTAPAGVTFVDDSVQQNVPGGSLAANENIGVWIEMSRAADAPAIKSSYTTQLAGTTV